MLSHVMHHLSIVQSAELNNVLLLSKNVLYGTKVRVYLWLNARMVCTDR